MEKEYSFKGFYLKRGDTHHTPQPIMVEESKKYPLLYRLSTHDSSCSFILKSEFRCNFKKCPQTKVSAAIDLLRSQLAFYSKYQQII